MTDSNILHLLHSDSSLIETALSDSFTQKDDIGNVCEQKKEDQSISAPAGNQQTRLLYLEDAYLKDFEARAMTVKKLDNKYELVLDQTCFYPGGGGQPADTGTITGRKGTARIVDVYMDKDAVVHIANEIVGEINEGEQVTCTIDWSRRYQLMRNHTLAHLMAEAVRKVTGLALAVVSSGLDVDKARLDFAHEGSLGPMLPEIEKTTNDLIKENREVKIKVMPHGDAEVFVERFHESLKTLPPHVQSVRVVEVRDWHACACGGTHVKRTGEIGAVAVLRRMSKGKGVERLKFTAKTS